MRPTCACSKFTKSLENVWRKVEQERNPWWNFTYSIFVSGCCLEDALRTLRELPREQLNWRKENSSRPGIKFSHRTVSRARGAEVLPYNEFCIQRWNGDPYLLTPAIEAKPRATASCFSYLIGSAGITVF